MVNEERIDSETNQTDEMSSGFVGKEKSLEGFTKEEPVMLEPSEIVESVEDE